MGIVVFGAVFVDIKGYPEAKYIPGGRNVGRVLQVHGGVSRNVAEDIGNIGLAPTFVSVVDKSGTSTDVLEHLKSRGIETKYIRRTEDDLAISGLAVLAMGAWSSVKLWVNMALRYSEVKEMAIERGFPLWLLTEMLILIAVIAGGLGMLLHIYIGLSASADAFRRKIVPPYVMVSVVLFAGTVLSALDTVILLEEATESSAQTASLIIDMTLLFALFQLIRAARRLKRMRREVQTAEVSGEPR